MGSERFKEINLWPLFTGTTLLFIWETAGWYWSIKEYILPAPSQIARSAFEHRHQLLSDFLATTSEALAALCAGGLLALVLAISFHFSSRLRSAVLPLLIAFKSVPIVVFAPLFALWFGYGPLGKVVLGTIVAFLPITVNTTFGMDDVSKEQLDLFVLRRASKWAIITKLRLPSSIPFIFPAARISATLAVLGVVLGEMTGAKDGLGATILIAGANFETSLLFSAALCALASCGVLLLGLQALEAFILVAFRRDLARIIYKVDMTRDDVSHNKI